MNKAVPFLLLFASTTGFAASELTIVDEPAMESNAQQSTILKGVGVDSGFKSSKRIFLRDGVKVAALITTTESIGEKPPTTRKFVQFYIDSGNWLEINLDNPKIFSCHFTTEVSVSASEDSITVTAPKIRYCEVFFKSTGSFLDGAMHERFAHDSFLGGGGVAPR